MILQVFTFWLVYVFIFLLKNIKIILMFFHSKKSENLHKFVPVASSGNLLLKTAINKNIKNSEFFNKINSLIIFHFLRWIIKWMLIVKHLMQNDSKRIYITLMSVDGFPLTLMKVNLWSHCVWSSTFLAEYSQFWTNRFSKSKIWNFYAIIFQ